ncbi:HET-domain-containing protein [Aspergillus terreus]|uniref:HET-domain-containing protein n=1 Tax=Aspergillus terreus TaxID=33178 RepID=A0A5M3YU15_ASPTE|nr:hypothetical protein ATETN484_0003071400 [Aspergillus terreus]GFF14700.1 HET-domain-containing protein [Aspergillus terreus]
METYCYSKLSKDEIRLVDLHPASFSDRIKISISHIPLPPSTHNTTRSVSLNELEKTLPPKWSIFETTDRQILFYFEDTDDNWKSCWEHPDPTVDLRPYQIPTREPKLFHYEALSYTWGEDHGSETAYVVSSAHDTQLRIGANLALALRHLRSEDGPRALWVDAICINQEDLSEREQQVQRMSTIFREADRVVVWLGPESTDSNLAMQRLDFIGKQVVNTMDNWNISSPEAVAPDWCYFRYAIPYSTAEWTAINAFLHRDWFSRVWVVQEIQLATDAVLQCGFAQMSWSYFRRAVVLLWGKQDPCPCLSRHRLSFIERLANVVQADTPVYHRFHLTAGRSCADPRDRIYGALGLFPDDFQLKVSPQYSLPVGDVYLAFVRAHIEHVQRLELLKNCQLHGRTTNAPSWVPDFSSKFPTLKGAEWQFVSGYAACDVRFEGSTLSVLGVHSATVRTVTPPIPNYRSDSDPSTFLDSIMAIRELIRTNFVSTMGECVVPDNAARAMTGNYLVDRFPENNVLTLEQWKEHLRSPTIFGDSITSENEGDLPFQEEFALGFLLGRVYLSTDEGYVGLGPPGTEPGDQIVSLLGCDSPMVLRKGPHGGFLVVGEYLMPELSDSRDFLGPLPSPWRVQYFIGPSDRIPERWVHQTGS